MEWRRTEQRMTERRRMEVGTEINGTEKNWKTETNGTE